MSEVDKLENDLTFSSNDEKNNSVSPGSFGENQARGKKLFSSKFWKVLVILLILIAVGAFLEYESKNLRINETREINVEITPQTAGTPRDANVKNWVLKKNVNGQFQIVHSLCDNCAIDYVEHVKQWNNWLFYPDSTKDDIQIKGYNLEADEIKIIYSLKENEADFQGRGKGLPREISDIQVINNTLFFSLGGYLTASAMYWVDLPPSAEPQKIASECRNAKITPLKGHYFVISGEGDSCGGFRDYSLLDLETKEVTYIATSELGCAEGEEYIDIDKRDRMILAFHTPDSITGWPGEEKRYQYVVAVPLSNPSLREEIITKEEMPPGITSIKYLEDSDQLLLLGEYLYDFSLQLIRGADMPIIIPTISPEIKKEISKDNVNKLVEDKTKNFHLPPGYILEWE